MATFCDIDNCNNLSFRTDKNTRKHYCSNHWRQYSTDIDKRSITQKALSRGKIENKPQKEPRFPKLIQTPTEQNIIEIRPVSAPIQVDYSLNQMGMDSFWKYAENVIIKGGSKCWECGDIISRSDYRNSTGHIFPKSIFLSVADNIYNFVVVGNRCGCHHKTHTLSTFSQMSIFPTAVNRYLKFGHLITENHKYLDLFLDYANQII